MASIASWQLRPGLNPYERGSNRASHSGSRAWRTGAWGRRSVITGGPSGRSFLVSPAFGMCTRLTARGCQEEQVRCTRTASSARAWEVNATSPSMPAVLRPALRCVTCRTLTSVFDQLRSISFCRFLTLGQSPSRTALKILLRSRRTSSSCRRQSMESHPAAVSAGRRPSGPFAIGVQLALSVLALCVASPSTAHLPTSARFRVRAGVRPVSGQFGGNDQRRSWSGCSRLLSPFGHRRWLLGHPVLAKEVQLPLRSAYHPEKRRRGP